LKGGKKGGKRRRGEAPSVVAFNREKKGEKRGRFVATRISWSGGGRRRGERGLFQSLGEKEKKGERVGHERGKKKWRARTALVHREKEEGKELFLIRR